MNLDIFREMVELHDLTYDYSEDGRVWNRGFCEKGRIQEAMKQLDHDSCVEIWNAEVDRKLKPEFRKDYYWKKKGE